MTDPKEVGKYHKLWFYISTGLCTMLDMTAVASVLLFFPFGSFYLGIAAAAFLLRVAITAANWKTARFAPMETEYRVTLLEDKVLSIERNLPLRTVEV